MTKDRQSKRCLSSQGRGNIVEMEKSSIKRSKLIITSLPIVILLIVLIWFLMTIFEGEKPLAQLEPLPEYLSKPVTFSVVLSDLKMGLRDINVSVKQEGPGIPILKREFPYEGLFNKKGVHRFEQAFSIDPKQLNLVQGQANLIIEIHDFSKRRGGDGNLTIIEHKMVVDTIPPSISAMSRSHNLNMGGSGLVIYRISTDTEESGILVNDQLFPGVPLRENSHELYLCYFAVPYQAKKEEISLYLWAKDRAGNTTKGPFFHHVRKKRFRRDKIRISERLLDAVVSSFPPELFEQDASPIDKYLFINSELRNKNYEELREHCRSFKEERLWDGPWLRMKNAATMSQFGEQRIYYYKGKAIDRSVHLGVDLASLARAPVQAANNGRVTLAGDLGIYGQSVVIDHGQGLSTLYGHLSSIDVAVGQSVTKGEVIGNTGHSGLATGDHLHFGFLVHGVPVNPIEWWDAHWIQDNIDRKLHDVDKLIEK
jgi:murein DD-endopeptidase MepM/ murein hydrolase activator NlpD